MHVFALVICFEGASTEMILFNGVRKEKEELSEWPGDKKRAGHPSNFPTIIAVMCLQICRNHCNYGPVFLGRLTNKQPGDQVITF